MNVTVYVIAIILIIFFLAFQLIKMNMYMLKLQKDKKLSQVEIKEDTSWEFIKGLY